MRRDTREKKKVKVTEDLYTIYMCEGKMMWLKVSLKVQLERYLSGLRFFVCLFVGLVFF